MKVIRIGRDESNDYLVKHPSVSRFHSEIRIDDDGNIVYIDHSANGTMINGSIVHNAQYNYYKIFYNNYGIKKGDILWQH